MKGQYAQKKSDRAWLHGDHDQNGRNQVEIKLYRSEKFLFFLYNMYMTIATLHWDIRKQGCNGEGARAKSAKVQKRGGFLRE